MYIPSKCLKKFNKNPTPNNLQSYALNLTILNFLGVTVDKKIKLESALSDDCM